MPPKDNINFLPGIRKIGNIYNFTLNASSIKLIAKAIAQLNQQLAEICKKKFKSKAKDAVMEPEVASVAVHDLFEGDLECHALAEGSKAITKYNVGILQYKPVSTRSRDQKAKAEYEKIKTEQGTKFGKGVANMCKLFPGAHLHNNGKQLLCRMLGNLSKKIANLSQTAANSRTSESPELSAIDIKNAVENLLPENMRNHALAEGAKMIVFLENGRISVEPSKKRSKSSSRIKKRPVSKAKPSPVSKSRKRRRTPSSHSKSRKKARKEPDTSDVKSKSTPRKKKPTTKKSPTKKKPSPERNSVKRAPPRQGTKKRNITAELDPGQGSKKTPKAPKPDAGRKKRKKTAKSGPALPAELKAKKSTSRQRTPKAKKTVPRKRKAAPKPMAPPKRKRVSRKKPKKKSTPGKKKSDAPSRKSRKSATPRSKRSGKRKAPAAKQRKPDKMPKKSDEPSPSVLESGIDKINNHRNNNFNQTLENNAREAISVSLLKLLNRLVDEIGRANSSHIGPQEIREAALNTFPPELGPLALAQLSKVVTRLQY